MRTGRTKIKVDWKKVDNLLKSQCDGTGIAQILGVCADTLYRRCVIEKKMTFSEYATLKKSEGKELLRAKQFQVAMDGDTTMQIWLGKQYLEQKNNHTVNVEKPIVVEHTVDVTKLPTEILEAIINATEDQDK